MIMLTPELARSLRSWFLPDRPGPLVGLHVLQTGNGVFFADRWPQPRAILVNAANNYTLLGDPAAIQPEDLRRQAVGFVEADESFEPLLREARPETAIWDRVILALPDGAPIPAPGAETLRCLETEDAYRIWGLNPEIDWIANTWGGPAGLAASGHAWGAFSGERLVSVACSFYVGAQYEDVGIVTEPDFRGSGLSPACAAALCGDIRRRGRRPSWSTSPDNTASLRVAEKLGFVVQRRDRLYAFGRSIPGQS